MAVIQSSSHQAIDVDDVRPGRPTKKSLLEDMIKNQAFVYESLTNVKVPDASSISATPHAHDGTTGETLKHPLFCETLNIKVTTGGSQDTFYPLVHLPFYAPVGVTQLDIYVGCPVTPRIAKVTAINMFDSSENEAGRVFGESVYGSDETFGNSDIGPHLKFTVDVTEADFGSALLSVSNYSTHQYEWAYWWAFAVPAGTKNSTGIKYVEIEDTNTDTIVPDATEYDAAHEFTPFDSDWVRQAVGWSSYHLVKMAKNNALMTELLCGVPAGSNAAGHSNNTSYDGHNHKNDATTAINDSGAYVDHCLLSVALGGAIIDYYTGPSSNYGITECHGIEYVGTSASAYRDVAKPYFKIPALKDVDVSSTSRLNFRALIYNDSGKSVFGSVRIQLQKIDDDTGASGAKSTAQTFTGSKNGLEWVGGTIDLSAWTSPYIGDGCNARLEVEFAKTLHDAGFNPFLLCFLVYVT